LPVVYVDGYDEVIQVFKGPAITKATGIASFQQSGKRVIGNITPVATFINITCFQVDIF
jgi:hypothetical protein